jgi:hypothetical protein
MRFCDFNMDKYNQQSVVPTHFASIRKKQQEEKKVLINFLVNECSHLLYEDMWNYICNIMYPTDEKTIAYFAFKRKNIYYKDTYYLFAGTEQKFHNSMNILKSYVDPGELLDSTPMDTFCSGSCSINSETCPDKNGNCCDCMWEHITFNSREEFNTYTDYIHKNAHNESYYKHALITDISNLDISSSLVNIL